MSEDEHVVKVGAKVHIDCQFRNDQNTGDDFELWFGFNHSGDPFWLNRTELAELRDRCDQALEAHDRASEAIAVREAPQREGWARVYLGPEPVEGPHSGIRGYIVVDAIGVHAAAERTEWLRSEPGEERQQWFQIERDVLMPWAGVDQIEWEPEDPRGRALGTTR